LNTVVIYADGAAAPNPGRGGYGVVMLRDGQRQELAGGFRKTTNNRMEILGVIVGLRAVREPDVPITIYSDSRYVVDMINGGHVERWRRDGWTRNRGKDAALNPDLWDQLLTLCRGRAVKFVWVRGHNENKENTRCDELAVQARQAGDLPVDEGYESAGLTAAPAVAPLVLPPVQASQASPPAPRQLTLFDGF
jgi:ribonuclease HI